MLNDGLHVPIDPITAATHADPYPYYGGLTAERPIYRDEALGVWVASSAATVAAVLTSCICRVRPPNEPVPRSIQGTQAGEIFGHLVRMNDGENHCPFKQAIVATLNTIDAPRLTSLAWAQAKSLDARLNPELSREGLTRFVFALPVQVIASLLGVPEARFEEVTAWVDKLVVAFSPIATQGDVEAGSAAAAQLMDLFRRLPDGDSHTLQNLLASEARRAGRGDRGTIVANGIGFMSQTYESTAGLIGNTLLALSRHEDVCLAVRAKPALIRSVVQEALRFDPPTQSTRRFLAEDGTVAGQPMRNGDTVVVLLGAAGRDPAVNSEPNRFDILRTDRRILNFGTGLHACPGDNIAARIAEIGVAHLLPLVEFKNLEQSMSYRRSVAVRAPIFCTPDRVQGKAI